MLTEHILYFDENATGGSAPAAEQEPKITLKDFANDPGFKKAAQGEGEIGNYAIKNKDSDEKADEGKHPDEVPKEGGDEGEGKDSDAKPEEGSSPGFDEKEYLRQYGLDKDHESIEEALERYSGSRKAFHGNRELNKQLEEVAERAGYNAAEFLSLLNDEIEKTGNVPGDPGEFAFNNLNSYFDTSLEAAKDFDEVQKAHYEQMRDENPDLPEYRAQSKAMEAQIKANKKMFDNLAKDIDARIKGIIEANIAPMINYHNRKLTELGLENQWNKLPPEFRDSWGSNRKELDKLIMDDKNQSFLRSENPYMDAAKALSLSDKDFLSDYRKMVGENAAKLTMASAEARNKHLAEKAHRGGRAKSDGFSGDSKPPKGASTQERERFSKNQLKKIGEVGRKVLAGR